MAIHEDLAARNDEIKAVNVIKVLRYSESKIDALNIAISHKTINIFWSIPAQFKVCSFSLFSVRSPIDQVDLI